MKKYLNILMIFVLVFALTGCFGKTSNNDDVEDAKQQILNNSGSSSNNQDVPKYEDNENEGTNTGSISTSGSGNISNDDNKTIEKYTVNYLGSENFIEIDNLDKQDFVGRKVEITGKTLVDVDKIIVNFSNSSSNYPDDRYTLSQFKSGDKTFLYRAFSQYQTLDYGVNEYVIEAYSGDDIARVEVTINISRPGKENINNVKTNTEKAENTKNEDEDQKTEGMTQPLISSLDLASLPKNTDYGNPENLGGGKVGYSRIDGLELKMISPNLNFATSDDVNSFLIDNLNGWFFWNTLRSGDPLSSVYVIRLDGNKYVYEKHYYLNNGIYGILTLESGTGVDKDNISDANIELRDKNDEFDTSNADKLFNDLSK